MLIHTITALNHYLFTGMKLATLLQYPNCAGALYISRVMYIQVAMDFAINLLF